MVTIVTKEDLRVRQVDLTMCLYPSSGNKIVYIHVEIVDAVRTHKVRVIIGMWDPGTRYYVS